MQKGRKKEASKVKQIIIKAKQHSTPKVVTFPKKNKLPQVGSCTHVFPCMCEFKGHAIIACKQGREGGRGGGGGGGKPGNEATHACKCLHVQRSV